MKYYCLLLVLLIISCRNNDGKATYTAGSSINISGFTIITDTVTINQNENIVPELKYGGNYYCLSCSRDSSGDYSFNSFYIIDKLYNVKKVEGTPGYTDFGTNDMHVRHDSIVVKSAFDAVSSSYLDEKNKEWKTIKADDVIFEDADYYVTSLDFGEWGSATWFKDKKTGTEYEIAGILPPEIKKFKGIYYLISPSEINSVSDPKLLKKAGKGAYKSFFGNNKAGAFYSREHSYKNEGLNNIFRRKITYEIENSFYIGPSFIHNNDICFVVSDSSKTYIAKAQGKELLPVANIGNLYTKRYTNQYRNLYRNKTIKFATRNRYLHGLMEIRNDTILLHYFKQGVN